MDPDDDHRTPTRSRAGLGAAVPVLRVQEWPRAQRFYCDHLGFTVAWEHRFEPGLPTYARVVRDGAEIDLSEHHGDGTPGTVVWLPVRDVVALHDELHEVTGRSAGPGIEADAPGGPTMTVIDPFGNTLRFCQPDG